MALTQPGSTAGIVFRRLDAADEQRRAVPLLAAHGLHPHDPACAWYGLCDLTVAETDGLAGVVVVCPVDATTVQLCGLAVSDRYRSRGLGWRLLCEVADRLRASGVEQIVAPPVPDRGVTALLARAGFAAVAQDHPAGSLSLPL
jgi:ribosomal protein S18 acetylase RimI-like enzyme